MTATCSATSSASSWSCVTKIVVTCTSSCNLRSQSRNSFAPSHRAPRTARFPSRRVGDQRQVLVIAAGAGEDDEAADDERCGEQELAYRVQGA